MMSPTSMISSSWFSLPSTLLSTTNTQDLNVVIHDENIQHFDVNQHNPTIILLQQIVGGNFDENNRKIAVPNCPFCNVGAKLSWC